MKIMDREQRLRKRIERHEKKIRRRYNRKPTAHDWLFVYTGTEMDIMSYVSVLFLNPGFIFFGTIMATGRVYNPVLVYIVVDGITIIGWTVAALYKKKKQDEWNALTREQKSEYFKGLIDELEEEETPKLS
jgi:hypothetical protein